MSDNMIRVVKVRPSGEVLVGRLENDLDSFGDAIGGWAECPPTDEHTAVWVDEDGGPKDLDPNPVGWALARRIGYRANALVGVVLFVGRRNSVPCDADRFIGMLDELTIPYTTVPDGVILL